MCLLLMTLFFFYFFFSLAMSATPMDSNVLVDVECKQGDVYQKRDPAHAQEEDECECGMAKHLWQDKLQRQRFSRNKQNRAAASAPG